MSEEIIGILKARLESGDKDQKKLVGELRHIFRNSRKLEKIVNITYYGTIEEKIPLEFREPERFLNYLDNTKRSVGNTIRILGVFKVQKEEEEEPAKQATQTPIIMMGKETKEPPQAARQPTRGFLSGFHDVTIARLELQAKTKQDETPTITTQKVTYDLENMIHQIIPSLNQIKDTYFQFVNRHETYPKENPSYDLLIHGHKEIRKEISKLLLVIDAFCYASIRYQEEKIRNEQLQQVAYFSRIATAEAQARAMSQPYIPPEVQDWARARREGRGFSDTGFAVPSSDEVAASQKRKKQ